MAIFNSYVKLPEGIPQCLLDEQLNHVETMQRSWDPLIRASLLKWLFKWGRVFSNLISIIYIYMCMYIYIYIIYNYILYITICTYIQHNPYLILTLFVIQSDKPIIYFFWKHVITFLYITIQSYFFTVPVVPVTSWCSVACCGCPKKKGKIMGYKDRCDPNQAIDSYYE